MIRKAISLILTLLLPVMGLVSCSKDSTTQPELTLAQELQAALDNGIATYGGKGISAAVYTPATALFYRN